MGFKKEKTDYEGRSLIVPYLLIYSPKILLGAFNVLAFQSA